jgi:MFS family permease
MTQALQGVRAPDRPCVDGLDRPARIQRLAVPREAAFWLVAYVFGATILGTSLPAPLYSIYQRQWHFSSAVLTLIFAAYAVAVLATLLVAGRASDQVGRKPVMAAALGFSVLSTVVFILAPSVGWLYLGRVLSGLSAGLMTGAAPAALTEMLQASESRRSSMVATAANMSGAGLGPLIAGLFAEYLPQSTVLVFEAYLGLLVIAGLAVAFVPETVTSKQRLTLRFTGLAVPRDGRSEFIAAGLAAFAAFALTGLFTSLAPGFVGSVLHQMNFAVAGAVSFLIFAAACAAQLGLGRINSRPVMLAGLGGFLAGLALVVAGIATSSLGWFVAGDVVGGFAVGALFIGSMSAANRLAPPERRAEVISTYFVFAYTGLIIPVVGVGIAADYVGDFRATLGCSIGLAALCLWSAAVVSGRPRGRSRPTRQEGHSSSRH